MTTKLRYSASALAFGCAACLAVLTMRAQPMYDRIHVNLPYTVTMQNKTLQPGDYTIQQLPSAGDSRVLLFYSNDGMKFETSAMTIPTLDNKTPSDTRLILNHVGEDFYISKIWVQGKDYGYELPVPDSIKSRQNERVTESTVPGSYQPSSSTEPTTSATTTTPPPAESTPAPANSNNTADTANRPQAETAPAQPAPVETAQSTPPPAQPEPQPAADTQPTGSANREMPATAAGWLTMLLSGGALSGAGLMLRRKR